MRTKKLLSLILTLCLVFTTIGSLGIVNAEDVTITKTINLEKGEAYTLPTTLADSEGTEVDVTWSPATVDTDKIGYKLYTGTLADSTTVTYRVNVGEYVQTMYDNMDGHTTNYVSGATTADNTSSGVVGGTFTMNDYNKPETSNSSNTNTLLPVTDGTNKVLSFGPDYTKTGNYWTADTGSTGGFKLSADIKIAELALGEDSAASGAHAVLTLQINGKQMMLVRAYTEKDATDSSKENFSGVKLRLDNYDVTGTNTNSSGAAGGLSAESGFLSFNTDPVNNNGKISTEYFNVEIVANSETYELYVNGIRQLSDKTLYLHESLRTNVNKIMFAKRTKSADVNATTYLDNVTFSPLVYYAGDISTETVTDTLELNSAASQTAAAALTMNDGSTKEFTVNYTADTSSIGTGKIAEGTIEGFSEKVTVTYDVLGVEEKVINTYVGAELTLEDGTEVNTSVMGRKYYQINVDGGIIKYTVNVGRYSERVKDTMDQHTAATQTVENKDGNTATVSTITPNESKAGIRLTITNSYTDPNSLVPDENNQYLYVEGKTPSGHAQWDVIDCFNGDFKISVRMKLEDIISYSSVYTNNLRVYGSNGKAIAVSGLYLTGTTVNMRGAISPDFSDLVTASASHSSVKINSIIGATSEKHTITNDDNTTTNYYTFDSEWFTHEILVHNSTRTYDLIVNDVVTHEGLPFLHTQAVGNVGFINFDRRTATSTLTGKLCIDDMAVYQYNCFTDDIPNPIDVVTAVGSNNAKTYLTLSNGSSEEFNVILDNSLNVNSFAKHMGVDASIEGFDGTVKANVKICNYDVTGANLKSGDDYVPYPVAEGTLESIRVKKMTDAAAQTAIIVQYGSNDIIKAIKTVDLSNVTFEEEKEAIVPVGMIFPQTTASGDYIRVYLWDSKTNLQPLDMITDMTFDYTAVPKVYVAAASTYQSYSYTENPNQWPKAGLGQMLVNYLDDSVSVVNLARSGASTQSFIEDGLWNRIKNEVQTGDYVIISFGHNDQEDCKTAVDTETGLCQYGENLQMFIDDVRERGANPILCSPIVRRVEGIKNTPSFNNTHGHITQMENVSKVNNVDYIDITTLTGEYIRGLSDPTEESKHLYIIDLLDDGGYLENYTSHKYWSTSRFADDEYRYKNTVTSPDNTHTTIYGGKVYAKILAEEIAKLDNHLSKFIDANAIAETIKYPALD